MQLPQPRGVRSRDESTTRRAPAADGPGACGAEPEAPSVDSGADWVARVPQDPWTDRLGEPLRPLASNLRDLAKILAVHQLKAVVHTTQASRRLLRCRARVPPAVLV